MSHLDPSMLNPVEKAIDWRAQQSRDVAKLGPPEISVMVRHDEARHLEGSERCPSCNHLDVLHDRQGCQLCKCDEGRP